MRFGLDVPTTGDYADPRALAQLAMEAEVMGWDGYFIWDVLLGGKNVVPSVDPWIALTAIALHTTRIRIGLFVLPLPRHRPWLVARQLANLDQLSGGRVTCTVGIGHQERDFSAFGEPSDLATRAAELDEGLEVLTGLWGGEAFAFEGGRYTVRGATILPKPVQMPRIPIWAAGGWPQRAPFRRAASWDGVCLKSHHQERRVPLTLEDFRACAGYVRRQRVELGLAEGPFDIVMSGETPLDTEEAGAKVRPFADAGATWWVEEGLGFSLDELRERIRSGPPRG